MLTVNLNGEYFAQVSSPDQLPELAAFAEVNVADFSIPAEELEAYEAQSRRLAIRADLPVEAGDTISQVGTIADNVGLLLEELGRFMASATSSSDPVIAAAAQPLADALAPLVAAVDANTCKLTHHVKGTSTVVTDACNRANAVAGVLESHAAP